MRTLDCSNGAPGYDDAGIYWIRIVGYAPGATLQIDGGAPRLIRGTHKVIPPLDRPFKRIDTTGAVIVELGDANDLYPGGSEPNSLPPAAIAQASAGLQLNLAIDGSKWASVIVSFPSVTNPGTGWKVVYGIDGGAVIANGSQPPGSASPITALRSCYPKRLDLNAANPTVYPNDQSATPIAGSSWEVVIPANTTNVQVQCFGAFAGVASIAGFVPAGPRPAVTGVLYDVTSAVNTAQDTGALDVSGWDSLLLLAATPAGGAGSCLLVDDAGATVAIGGSLSAGSTVIFRLPDFGGAFSDAPLPKRVRVTETGVAALTSRVRLEVRR